MVEIEAECDASLLAGGGGFRRCILGDDRLTTSLSPKLSKNPNQTSLREQALHNIVKPIPEDRQ